LWKAREPRRLLSLPDETVALAHLIRTLQQRGIEIRIVFAPYALPITNAPGLIRLIEARTGMRVLNYIDPVKDRGDFADGIHLNETGSRELLSILVRDGVFGMARTPARL